jgi:hypothetical protein
MISRSFKNADIEYFVQFIFYIDFGVQSRREDEKADASSGPSWFRGHRWVKNSNNNGFRPHDFYYGNFRSKGTIQYFLSFLSDKHVLSLLYMLNSRVTAS